MSRDRILIEGLSFECIVGILPEERITPQTVRIDIELETDLTAAAAGGDIARTIDYGVVARDVQAFVEDNRFLLLETLAVQATELLMADTRISGVDFTVRKPGAIAGASAAGVRIYRSR